MKSGHVHVLRKIWKNPVLMEPGKKFSRLEAWLWLITIEAKGLDDAKRKLKRGEFCASRRQLARVWNWSRSAVQRFLEDLQKGDDPMIKSLGQQTGHFSEHFIICKYGLYNKMWDAKRDSKRDILNKEEIKTEIKDSPPSARAKDLFDIFQRENKVLPKVRNFDKDMDKKCRTRLKNAKDLAQYLTDFADAVKHANETPFCRGEGPRKWKVTFDWLIKNDRNLYKIIDGNYDGECGSQDSEAHVGTSDERETSPAQWTDERWKIFERINGPEAARRLRAECNSEKRGLT